MKECSKSISRRLSQPNFLTKYFYGHGIDIGGKPDPLSLYTELFPMLESVKTWDLEDGDAQYLESIDDNTLDFVHSSHCLEHLVDPLISLKNWIRVIKPNSYIIFTVPDEDMYEQGVFPSTFNLDHKWTFTVFKNKSWSDKSINLLELLVRLDDTVSVEKIEVLNSTFRSLPRYDQTLTPVGECGIEVVLKKRSDETQEIPELTEEMTIHLNQYRDDMASMKNSNNSQLPFQNKKPIK